MSQIEIINLCKTYIVGDVNITAVNDVSISINKGEFISVTGHSGSGKTTLISLIGGIITPTSGKVLFEGIDTFSLGSDGLSEYRCNRIGIMFQFASLLPILTAKENLMLPVVFKEGRASSGPEEKAVELLKMVGLGDKINAYPSQLSGGQQRRVAIARAFMNGPSVILADEPTGDLDEETEGEMMSFFQKMNKKDLITFIMVTHSSELAKQTERRFQMSSGIIKEI